MKWYGCEGPDWETAVLVIRQGGCLSVLVFALLTLLWRLFCGGAAPPGPQPRATAAVTSAIHLRSQ